MTPTPDILAFDPGVTVGVCVLDTTGSVLLSVSLAWDHFDLDYGRRLRETHSSVSDVVVEEGPSWTQNHRIEVQSVEHVLRQVFPDAHWVRPSEWKGTPQASNADIPLGSITQHERDAVKMATWFRAIRERRVAS